MSVACRQERKVRKRKERLAERKAYKERTAREQKRRERYPKIVFDTTCGTPEFVEAVRTAVAQIDFDDKESFSNLLRWVYRTVAQHGAAYALQALKEMKLQAELSGNQFAPFAELHVLLSLGDQIYRRIPEELRRKLLPYNDLDVLLRGREIELRFSSLESRRGSQGTIYFSRHRPTIEFQGQKYVVGFSRHAIERICERLNPRYLTYAAAGDVHALFARCVYFEPAILHGGQRAFSFYDVCGRETTFKHGVYLDQVIGKENLDRSKGEAYYRVGYCPVVLENGFAKATTFLYPGYTATPEYGLVLRSDLPPKEKARMRELAKQQDANSVILDNEIDAIKWFHENGVPQVIQTKQTIFRYDRPAEASSS